MADAQTTLWIVYGTTGEYYYRSGWNVAVVESEADAQALVTMLMLQYQSIPPDMLDDYWDSSGCLDKIMTLDPNFSCDYTGTHYYYGSAPLVSRADIIAAAEAPTFTSAERATVGGEK